MNSKKMKVSFVAKNLRSWRSLCGRSFHFLPWVVLWRVPEFWMCVQGFARQEYLKLITSDRVLGRFSQELWTNTCTLLAMRSGVLSISSTPQTQEKDGLADAASGPKDLDMTWYDLNFKIAWQKPGKVGTSGHMDLSGNGKMTANHGIWGCPTFAQSHIRFYLETYQPPWKNTLLSAAEGTVGILEVAK